MKKKLLLSFPVCLVMFQGTATVTAQGACEPMDVPPVCQAGERITINNETYNISPPNICAAPGQVIDVNVVPSGSARIEGKSGWPTGAGESFAITAPDAPGEYDYNVYFDDGVCIDPRVTVK